MSDWASLLQDVATLRKPAPIPKGWATRETIQKDIGLGRSGTQALLSELAKAGKLETKKWKVQTNGVIRSTVIYRRK